MRFWISRDAPSALGIHVGQRGVDHADGAIGQRLAGVDAGRAFRQFFLDQAEFADGFAERLALLGVLDGVRQAVARAAHAGRAQLEASDVQNVEGDVVALAGFAQQVLHRHLAIGQNQRAGGRSANAELVLFLADRKARRVALDQEGGELLAIDLGEDGEQVGEAAVGDPHLLAVEHVVLCRPRESTARVRQFMASEPDEDSDSA